MSTIHGYGISLLLFVLGIGIPAKASEELHKPKLSENVVYLQPLTPRTEVNGFSVTGPTMEVKLATPAGEGIEKESLPQLPKVKNDHKGHRKQVPNNPEMRCPQFEPIFRAYGLFPVKTWSYIAWRESRCRPNAQNATWDKNGNVTYMLNKNGSYDTGLLQINSSWRTVTINVCGKHAVENRMQGLKDVDCNLRVARYIMENSSGGLSNWSM